MISNIKRYPECPMRHTNGNCNPVGGFCTSVQAETCDAAHKAWDQGFAKGIDTKIKERSKT